MSFAPGDDPDQGRCGALSFASLTADSWTEPDPEKKKKQLMSEKS